MLLKFLSTGERRLNLSMNQLLLLSCGFSCLLMAGRVLATGERSFLFLLWNLFLAYLPYALTERMAVKIEWIENRWKRWLLLSGWLLFVPNSFYIMTDLFHLQKLTGAPKWFDVLLIFSFAWNGLLLGILSVRKVEVILGVVQGRVFSFVFILGVMWLSAFGIYLGRYLRYNSWDVITSPVSLLEEIAYMFTHPMQHRMEWGMINTWGLFMTLFYFTIRTLSENFISHNSTIKS
jgi:uncharacterized membrane protein